MSDSTTKNIFITGVSSGIGHGLATWYLQQGWHVWGTSRREPKDLTAEANFHFASIDLADFDAAPALLMGLIGDVPRLDLAVLNAGVLGKFSDMADAEIDDLKRTMHINTWANKVVLDVLFASGATVEQVVAISSGASVNGNRGWSGYSISKAALNMLVLLYARERPETHFCAFAPGLVETEIQDELKTIPAGERYPSLANINAKRGTPEMPTPAEAAPDLAAAMARLPSLVESGAYADIRKPPLA